MCSPVHSPAPTFTKALLSQGKERSGYWFKITLLHLPEGGLRPWVRGDMWRGARLPAGWNPKRGCRGREPGQRAFLPSPPPQGRPPGTGLIGQLRIIVWPLAMVPGGQTLTPWPRGGTHTSSGSPGSSPQGARGTAKGPQGSVHSQAGRE